MLGGMALAGLIRYLASKFSRIELASTVAGILLGATAAGVSAWLSLRTALEALLEVPNPFVLLVIPALIIAAVAGGLVGRKLSSKYCRQYSGNAAFPARHC